MAFEEMGYQSFVYDAMMQEVSKEALLALLFGEQEIPAENIDLSKRFSVVTFNNLGYNLALSDGTNIWEKCNIPYLNILMDHPFHYEKPLRNAPDTSIVLGTDRNHVAYIRRFFGISVRQIFCHMPVWSFTVSINRSQSAGLTCCMRVHCQSIRWQG